MCNLSRLFRPSTVAVLGGQWAENVVLQLRRGGYPGEIWPVHPQRDRIGGVPAFRGLDALPSAPDVAFIGVNRGATPGLVRTLRTMGAGGAIAFASGFSEAGDVDLQAALVEAAGGMPVLGPNCYGILNYLDAVALWPDQHGGRAVDRGVGLISQSSNIAINLTMSSRGLPIGKVACVGNGAMIGAADLALHMIEDDRISALGLYLEGFGDAGAFAAMCEAASRSGKPVFAIKAGRTALARDAAASHTAALVGDGSVSSAFMAQCGVAEVRDPATLVEALKIAHVTGGLAGSRVASMSCSGGEAGLVADAAADTGIDFPAPTETQRVALADALGPLVTISNPLDYHTFIWGDESKMTAVFEAMLREGCDIGVLVMDMPNPARCDPAAWAPTLAAIRTTASRSGTPTALLTTLADCLPETLADALIADGIIPLAGLREGLDAIVAAGPRRYPSGWRPLSPRSAAGPTAVVDERAAKVTLAAAGLPVPRSLADVPGLPGPFAVKGLGFAHKSDAGAVRLGVAREAVDQAVADLPGPDGHLVEEMISGAVAEVLVAVRADAAVGATLSVGIGGTHAELLGDTATLVLPVTRDEIQGAFRSLALAPILHGYRGQPAADLAAAVDICAQLADVFAAHPDYAEIEINPLILREEGAVIADVLMIRKEPE